MDSTTGEVVFLGEIDDVEEVYDIISEYGSMYEWETVTVED